LAKGVEIAAIIVSKEQALDAQYFLAKDTPVDTGTARSNWRISIGRPMSGRIKAYSPFPSRYTPPYAGGGSKNETSNLNAVVAQGKARLSKYKSGTIYISNTLGYIGPLDRGHSNQTTAGFVARAVAAAASKTGAKIKGIFDQEMSK
jgi:hypothetical protein